VDEAAALFPTAPQEALSQLVELVQANAADPGIYLTAGALTLANNLPREALEQFFLPAFRVMPSDEEHPLNLQLRQNVGLAYYALSGDPNAEEYLAASAEESGQISESNLAWQRWRILYGDADAAIKELDAILAQNREAAILQLLYGDYASKTGKPAEAVVRYEAASRPRPLNPPAVWIMQEAQCRLRMLRDRKPELTPTCEPLNKLVQPAGPPQQP